MDSEHKRWRTTRIQAGMWYCGDNECDCTQPLIERITPNLEAGYPWIRREALWEGRFLSNTYEYSVEEREELQFTPLRVACQKFGIPIPPVYDN